MIYQQNVQKYYIRVPLLIENQFLSLNDGVLDSSFKDDDFLDSKIVTNLLVLRDGIHCKYLECLLEHVIRL